MSLLPKFTLLSAASALLFWWGGGLDGAGAWAVRLLVVLASALLAVRWCLSPWRDMERAVRRVLGGDFTARMDDVSGGYLAGPARAFNDMAEHLSLSQNLSREREERVNAVLAASDRAILLIGRDGTVSLSSPVTSLLFPRFRPEAGVASLALPGLAPFMDEVFSDGASRTRMLEEGERGMGRVFTARATPVEEGGLVLYLSEITEEHKLERVKADLVANVSHELRTPLTAMLGLAETLNDPALAPEKRAHFQDRLEFQIHRMQALVDDLLSLSRLESGQASVRTEKVMLAGLIGDLIRELQSMAASASITLEPDCSEDLALTTDRLLLEMALRNLAENGIRYNKPGGRVILKAREEGGTLVIQVRDTGEGIPSAHLPRIFERFYRVDPHRSREKGGTGLGLAIAKHAVNNIGGSLSVESTVGVGSVFTVRVRLGKGEPAAGGSGGAKAT